MHDKGTQIERKATRVAAIVLGLFFIFRPLASFFMYEHQRQELASSSILMICTVVFIYLVSIALGVLFIFVGISGSTPQWVSSMGNPKVATSKHDR